MYKDYSESIDAIERAINVIKAAESGKRPTDAVIRKFESILKIELMVEREAEETRFINSGSSRGMTFGDYFNDLR